MEHRSHFLNLINLYSGLCDRYAPEDQDLEKCMSDIRIRYDSSDLLVIEDILIRKYGVKISDILTTMMSVRENSNLILFFIIRRRFIKCGEMYYMFLDHSWTSISDTDTIKMYMMEYIAKDVDDITVDKSRHKDYIDKLGTKSLDRIIIQINSETFRLRLNKESIIRFIDGIYDVKNMEFRAGLPSDFVTMSTGMRLLDPYPAELEEMLDIFMGKIFPDEELRHYFMCYIASCIEGTNKNKVFCIWLGIGNNGKSALVSLIEKAFGSYACKSPTSLFVGKRSGSSQATPELAMLENRLISFVQESDNRESVNVGTLKELTGNDTIYVRDLYDTPRSIKIKAMFILVTNRVYNLMGADPAAWARIKVIPFESRFVTQKDYDDLSDENKSKNFYIMDPNFLESTPGMSQIFMKRVIKYYEKIRIEEDGYRCSDLLQCKKIKEATQNLIDQNSPVRVFVSRHLERWGQGQASLSNVYSDFKSWSRQYYNLYSFTIVKFTNELNKLGITVFESHIIGYRLVGGIERSINQYKNKNQQSNSDY